jgi:hypothetical protein
MVWAIRIKHQNGFFLVDAGKVEKIGLLPEPERLVAIPRENIIGMEDSQAAGRHLFNEIRPVSSEKSLIDLYFLHNLEIGFNIN